MSGVHSENFVVKEFDEFKNWTTIRHKNDVGTLGAHVQNDPIETFYQISFTMMRRKSADFDIAGIHATIKNNRDWFQANEGELIFNCDQENIALKFTDGSQDTEMFDHGIQCIEYGLYEMSLDQLKKICEANTLKIRLSGAIHKIDWMNDNNFTIKLQRHFRQFYNNVYDSSSYVDKIAEPKSGCFIATAAMGSYDEPRVVTLRKFRDFVLIPSKIGNKFVEFYYKKSPAVASWISGRPLARFIVRKFLIQPLAFTANLILCSKRGSNSAGNPQN